MVSLADRVAKIEHTIETVIIPDMTIATRHREEIKQDLERVLAVVTGAEKVGGFVVRYGPKAITFGAGIMTAAGLGNPEVLKFVGSFFGN